MCLVKAEFEKLLGPARLAGTFVLAPFPHEVVDMPLQRRYVTPNAPGDYC